MIKASDIRTTFCDAPVEAWPRAKAVITPLYTAQEKNWHFCHHPEIGAFRGQLYAMWSNAPVGEDELGQRILYARSADGQHWSEPEILCRRIPGEDQPRVLTAAGWLDQGDSLAAYFASYEYETEEIRTDRQGNSLLGKGIVRTRLFAQTTADGVHFADPVDLQVPLCPNFGPQRTKGGRLIITGNWAHAVTDRPDGVTPGSWALHGFDPGQPLLRTPVRDDPDYFGYVSQTAGLPGLCEGAFYQTDDGALHMLYRSSEDYLYYSVSEDEGDSWSFPEKTGFTNCRSKFVLGRLPDGRFYYIGNPKPGSGRNPLVLSLSEDGKVFDRHFLIESDPCERKYSGFVKNGAYAYPHSAVLNHTLYVVYSIYKEDVRVAAVPLDTL